MRNILRKVVHVLDTVFCPKKTTTFFRMAVAAIFNLYMSNTLKLRSHHTNSYAHIIKKFNSEKVTIFFMKCGDL